MTASCRACGCPIIDTYRVTIPLHGHRDTEWQTAYTIACGCTQITRLALPTPAELRENPDVADDWQDYIRAREQAA